MAARARSRRWLTQFGEDERGAAALSKNLPEEKQMRGSERSWPRPTVAVVDGCSQVRESFQPCFPSLDVLGTFATVEAFLGSGAACDLVVADIVTDGVGSGAHVGLSAVDALVAADHRVCVYTAERRVLVLAQCLAAGVAGLVNKSDPLSINEEAFVVAAQGGLPVADSLDGARDVVQRRGAPPRLTLRQRQVLHARARGESWQRLSDRLGISAKTAYDRLECVRAKFAWFLKDAGFGPEPSPADIEYALGLVPPHGLLPAHLILPDSAGQRKRSA